MPEPFHRELINTVARAVPVPDKAQKKDSTLIHKLIRRCDPSGDVHSSHSSPGTEGRISDLRRGPRG